MAKYLTQAQVDRLNGLIRIKGEHTGTLAKKLGHPRGSLLANISGHRRNAKVRQDLADFLGEPVEELFGNNDGAHPKSVPEKSGEEQPKNKPLIFQGLFFFLRRLLAREG